VRVVILDIIVTALLVLAFVTFLFAAIPRHYVESQGGDYPYYEEMTRELRHNSVPAPWRYRLLNPLMASGLIAIGLTPHAAFLTLTAIFAGVSCVLMRVLLVQLGVSLFAARAGALLFAVSVGAYIPLRRYYGYTDALTNALILFVLVSAVARRHMAVLATLAIGTVAKESLLLVAPFVAQISFKATRSVRLAAMVLAVPVVVFALLRIVVPVSPAGEAPVALTLQAQFDYWHTAMVNGVVRWILWAIAYSMGPVWAIAALSLPRNRAFAMATTLYVLPVLIPLLRTTDTERALMLLFPLVFPLAATAIDACHRRGHGWIAAGTAILCTWVAQLTFDWVSPWRIGPVNAKDLTFAALCIIPALLIIRLRAPNGAFLRVWWR
jgi:hypothetical protein